VNLNEERTSIKSTSVTGQLAPLFAGVEKYRDDYAR
jgi:hypothetical protein